MKEKILLFLGALSVREKALLFITALLLGAFLGMKASQSVLESFFDYDLTQLNEQKRLAQSSKDLYALVQAQKREFAELSELVAHFDNDEKGYLNELYALANAANINFTSIKNASTKDGAFAKHSIFIEFESDFTKCLSFLQSIEHSPLFFEFKEVKFSKNDERKTLETFLHLRFVATK